MESVKRIAGIVLAAGFSRRMGEPKLVLPWGDTTVIGRVVTVLHKAGTEPILVVTGAHKDLVEKALQNLFAQTVFNPAYAQDSMLSSVQAGIRALPKGIEAALIALGDQPQIEVSLVREMIAAYQISDKPILVPSYQMRRGHPWLIHRSLFQSLLTMQPPQTMRDFLQGHTHAIQYLVVDSDIVLRDLDTPQDYARQIPKPSD